MHRGACRIFSAWARRAPRPPGSTQSCAATSDCRAISRKSIFSSRTTPAESIGTAAIFAIAIPISRLARSCPSYYSPIGRGRIARHIPHCRIICTFRDPVEWRYSFYKLAVRNAWTGDDFESWVAKSPVNSGQGLGAWFETFGRDRVLVTDSR